MLAKTETETYKFNLEEFFPHSVYEMITEYRVKRPELIEKTASCRKKRLHLTIDGKLTILAADHPARGVTDLGSDPFKMANRYQYLGRVLRVIAASNFDGFMGTPDFIEDLFLIDYIVQENGGPSFLDDKVLVGCMQRGGVAGVVGELDDRFGSYTAESLSHYRLDGGKMMYRFVPSDERTLWEIDYCAKAVSELNRFELVPFVEVLCMDKVDDKFIATNTAENLSKQVGVISGFGNSSHNTWLKIPFCDNFELVAGATSLPILLLGGASKENPKPIYETLSAGMKVASNMRGGLVGRNVTFPGLEDPAAVAQGVWGIVHNGISVEQALALTKDQRDHDLDRITQYIR
jgi:hypothetical protein